MLSRLSAGHYVTPAEAMALAGRLHAATLAAVRERFGARSASGANSYAGWGSEGAPTGAVVHVPALAGRAALDGLDLCRRFMRAGAGASTHVVVDWPAGRVWVCVSPADRAWHAGRPWNHSHLGVDVVSPGPLSRHATQWAVADRRQQDVLLPDGSPLPTSEVIAWPGVRSQWPWRLQHWHAITPAQVRGLAVALRLLRCCYPDSLDPAAVVRHADIAPGRRVDPGPCVPLEQVREWAWSSTDLGGVLAGMEGATWAQWLREQWAAPTGLVTEMDRRAPGRAVG